MKAPSSRRQDAGPPAGEGRGPGRPGVPGAVSSADVLAQAVRFVLRYLEDLYDAEGRAFLPAGQPEPKSISALRGALQQYERDECR